LAAGYTGVGIRGHILEGIYQNHPDFAAKATRGIPIIVDDGAPDGHGQCTFGQVFGDGATKSQARGLLPDGQGYYTNNNSIYGSPTGAHGARYKLVKKLINEHKVLFQTASWGQPQSIHYDAYSRDLDEIIFELDIPITQSQSNTGTQNSRPQAWAKNVISVGAAYHKDNIDDSDDRWNNGASHGPAEDGRVKPDLCSFYDKILTTDGPSGHTENFGGTSGATPNVAGHVGLCLEMWTNGIFPCITLPKPATKEYRFENRPHASTVKALLIASATQFKMPGATDLSRFHQGWGRPNLRTLYELREKSLIVNETDILSNLQSKTYDIKVKAGEPALKITLVYPDPPGSPSVADQHRINNVDLKVTDPDGNIYWGNYGLLSSQVSTAGGSPNLKDTVENVFLLAPKAGAWKIEVIADEVVKDGHLATPAFDVAYALVALGIER
jgi:serine protease AprX